MELEWTFIFGVFCYTLGYLHKWWAVEHVKEDKRHGRME